MQSVSEIQVKESIDHLFRHHAGQMVSVLSRIFGFEKIDLIEDAVQEAMIAALRKWPFGGMPENPTAWLTQVAKNRVLDQIRRDRKIEPAGGDFEIVAESTDEEKIYFSSEMHEDQPRMIFACCHPSIAPDSQVALTLKIIGGFSVSEIARAYLSNDEAIAKMITRAKKGLRDKGVAFEIPSSIELNHRLDSVLRVLYLVFNEGYAASGGDELVRKDLCFEAIRLCRILTAHPVTTTPKVHALLALFMFQAARLSARCDHRGELLLLADQDRSLWDKSLLASGMEHFRRSAHGDELSDYHIEAEIAALHALAASYESTDWHRILECYERLQKLHFSVVAELNKIVVIEMIHGEQAALTALEHLESEHRLDSFNLFHITKAHFLAKIGSTKAALASYERALELTTNQPVRRFISGRIDSLKT